MIVKMKKVSVIALESTKENTLDDLRELGVLHVELAQAGSDILTTLLSRREMLYKALSVLPEKGKVAKQPRSADAYYALAEKVVRMDQETRELRETLERLTREKEAILKWGDFDPENIRALAAKGIRIKLYSLTTDQYDALAVKEGVFVLSQTKTSCKLAYVSLDDSSLAFDEVSLPPRGVALIDAETRDAEKKLDEIRGEIQEASGHRKALTDLLEELSQEIEYEQVKLSLGSESRVVFLSGYLPVSLVDELKKAASGRGWGLLVRDPGPEDNIPTLIKRRKPVKIAKPLFDFLEILPGYHEVDISTMFLLSFLLFVSMIIGDAGYGLVVLGFTLYARIKLKKAPKEPFVLFAFMGIVIVIWGVITGTWFGSAKLAHETFLSRFVLPSLASFPGQGGNNDKTIMLISFCIGLVHLSLARIEMFIRKLPSLTAFGELGWLFLLNGLFVLVLKLVLQTSHLFGIDLTPFMIPLIATGFGLIVVFGKQEKNFIKGVLYGLLGSPLTMLDTISSFSDIISYVRLFAVGLATVAVAGSFNSMAADIGFNGPQAVGAVLVLFLGHTLNLMMGFMSILVHGIRLNLLEYSGHMGLEWSGIAYNPFRKKV